jgi:hypothetical protein
MVLTGEFSSSKVMTAMPSSDAVLDGLALSFQGREMGFR